MYNETITHYGKNPTNKTWMRDHSVRYWEENWLCGDTLEVFLKIEDNKVVNWSFEWNTSIITTACASVFWESVIGMDINEVLTLWYSHIKELIWEDVSPRRRNASVLGLLATRNAIHEYLKDGEVDEFEMLLDI